MLRKIYVTESDKQKLLKLIDDNFNDTTNKDYIRELEKELARAVVISADRTPSDVITMNSKALLSVDGIEEEVSLVYPGESNISENRISVLSPIGTAILGYREGDSLEWTVPSGKSKVRVIKVLHQPKTPEQA